MGLGLPASQRGRVSALALVFAGATDPVLGPRAFERARRWHRDAYDVIALPGGHFLHREHPDRFDRELTSRLSAFVESNPDA